MAISGLLLFCFLYSVRVRRIFAYITVAKQNTFSLFLILVNEMVMAFVFGFLSTLFLVYKRVNQLNYLIAHEHFCGITAK